MTWLLHVDNSMWWASKWCVCQMYWGWHSVSVVLVFDSQSSRLSDDSRVSRASRLDLQPVGGAAFSHTLNSLWCSLFRVVFSVWFGCNVKCLWRIWLFLVRSCFFIKACGVLLNMFLKPVFCYTNNKWYSECSLFCTASLRGLLIMASLRCMFRDV